MKKFALAPAVILTLGFGLLSSPIPARAENPFEMFFQQKKEELRDERRQAQVRERETRRIQRLLDQIEYRANGVYTFHLTGDDYADALDAFIGMHPELEFLNAEPDVTREQEQVHVVVFRNRRGPPPPPR